MAQTLDQNELVTFKKLLLANSAIVDALAQLLIERGIITEEEFYAKLKTVKAQYEQRKATQQ